MRTHTHGAPHATGSTLLEQGSPDDRDRHTWGQAAGAGWGAALTPLLAEDQATLHPQYGTRTSQTNGHLGLLPQLSHAGTRAMPQLIMDLMVKGNGTAAYA